MENGIYTSMDNKEDKTMAKKWLPIPPLPPGFIVPTTWNQCMTYYEEQYYMWQVIQQLQERIEELEEQLPEE